MEPDDSPHHGLPKGTIPRLIITAVITGILCLAIWFLVPLSYEWRIALIAAAIMGAVYEEAKSLTKRFEDFLDRIFNPLKRVVKVVGRAGAFAIGILVGVVIGFFVARAWQSQPSSRSLLYISPVRSISSQPFYSEFLDRLIQESANDFSVTVWVPDDDWKAGSQQRLLKEAAKRKREYAALVFTPFIESSKDPGPEEEELLKFFSDTKDFNTVLFDTDLSEILQGRLIKEGLAIPPCMKGDEMAAGRKAAIAMVQYLYENQIWEPTIAVFDKLAPMERSIAFRQVFEIEARKKGIRPNPPVTWFWPGPSNKQSRDGAREIASINLTRAIDGVFAGNDISALGVRDVILDSKSKGAPPLKEKIGVVGYDGVNQVRELLKAGNEPVLINSVDVNLPEQVSGLVSSVRRLNSPDREKAFRRKLEQRCETRAPHLIKSVAGE